MCRVGPFPKLPAEEDEQKQEEGGDDAEPKGSWDELEEGDRLMYVMMPPDLEHVQATQTTSQRLAEAHYWNARADTKIPDYLREFESVFAKESFDKLLSQKIWDHAIKLELGSSPVNCKVYPMSPLEQPKIDIFIQENFALGRIWTSKSPMASPVFFIKKKEGSLRLVQDYRQLNAMTIKNQYPLPLIPELINHLTGAKYFTKVDLRWGYNNVWIKDGDEWKAAFRTNRGLYEPLVMFFGLTNSPAMFQAMMNDIFQDLIMEGVVCVYIDDILIYLKDRAEHRRVTRRVLEWLQEHKLYLRKEKCKFERTRIEYLGLMISEGKGEMDPVKVRGVTEWPTPKNRKEVQSFLGFANVYRHFIKDFSLHARPLFDLTKKEVQWKWGEDEEGALRKLKDQITSAPVLTFPDDTWRYRVEADTLDFATGATLSQQSPEDDT